jgi:hypothetical protein
MKERRGSGCWLLSPHWMPSGESGEFFSLCLLTLDTKSFVSIGHEIAIDALIN